MDELKRAIELMEDVINGHVDAGTIMGNLDEAKSHIKIALKEEIYAGEDKRKDFNERYKKWQSRV